MTKHMTGTRKEWLAARLELLAAEKELTRRSDELARRRQELPWVRIDKEYRFETDEGNASLVDLFRGRSQLLVYHFMFGPNRDAGCPGCSMVLDQICPLVHLHARDTSFAAVSRAPIAKIEAYRKRMGWKVGQTVGATASGTRTSFRCRSWALPLKRLRAWRSTSRGFSCANARRALGSAIAIARMSVGSRRSRTSITRSWPTGTSSR